MLKKKLSPKAKPRPAPKYMTREEIIAALVTEPLAAGSWIIRSGSPDCKVCAVGAVLRQKWADRSVYSRVCSLNVQHFTGYSDLDRAISQKNWLGALSAKFEGMMSEGGRRHAEPSADERMALVDFVMTNFPKRVRV